MNTESARSVDASISYLTEDSLINRRFVSAGTEVNTGTYESHSVKVHDGRAFAGRFTLDDNGFVLRPHVSAVRDFYDNDDVESVYTKEAEAIIKTLTGADVVITRGWMCRNSGDLEEKRRKTVNYQHHGGVQPPAAEAHVDFTRETATMVAELAYREQFPDQKPFRRFIATSLWRTFSPPPQDWPLALCDGASVGAEEGTPNTLVVVDEIPDRESMFADLDEKQAVINADVFRFNPEHRWWYFSNMTRDEVLLFKFYDSDTSVVQRVPHTAFRDESFPDATVRESIELRSIAYFT